mmetsp:Transcript_90851/g.132868  ORF Transcript_90851/g.132868 Transcript_90851/m.132868 type:complete len:201 (+) Transcript_90851:208-810(+)
MKQGRTAPFCARRRMSAEIRLPGLIHLLIRLAVRAKRSLGLRAANASPRQWHVPWLTLQPRLKGQWRSTTRHAEASLSWTCTRKKCAKRRKRGGSATLVKLLRVSGTGLKSAKHGSRMIRPLIKCSRTHKEQGGLQVVLVAAPSTGFSAHLIHHTYIHAAAHTHILHPHTHHTPTYHLHLVVAPSTGCSADGMRHAHDFE